MSFRALELGTADLERAQRFWTKTMGLEELSSGPDFVTLAAGETRWTLRQAETPPAVAHFAFNIPENQFDTAVAWLRERVPLLASTDGSETLFDFTDWNAHAVYFTDPDGNIAELIARHTLLSSRREQFEILGISEIGRATSVVEQQRRYLNAPPYSLPDYREGSETFRPVGDDEGLVILVQVGRPWYPDNTKRAAPVPFRVTFKSGAVYEGLA